MGLRFFCGWVELFGLRVVSVRFRWGFNAWDFDFKFQVEFQGIVSFNSGCEGMV